MALKKTATWTEEGMPNYSTDLKKYILEFTETSHETMGNYKHKILYVIHVEGRARSFNRLTKFMGTLPNTTSMSTWY